MGSRVPVTGLPPHSGETLKHPRLPDRRLHVIQLQWRGGREVLVPVLGDEQGILGADV